MGYSIQVRASTDEITKVAVAYLASDGKTQSEIAVTLQLSQAAVSRILRKSPHLEKQVRYRFRPDGLQTETIDEALKRASVRQLGPRLDAFAQKNGCSRGPVLRVFSTSERSANRDAAPNFTALAEQAAPYVRTLLMRDAVASCGLTWGYLLWELTIALRRLGAPRPWRIRGPIGFIPLTGDPLQHRQQYPPSLTSSNIAAELAKIANRDDAKRPPWLGIVPAFIPWEFQDGDIEVLERLIHMAPEYEEIFGSGGRPGIADNLDVILTSVGPADNPLGFGLGRLLGSIGKKKLDMLKDQIYGDIGGVFLPKNSSSPSKLIQAIEHRWKGLERKHLQTCAQRAFHDDPVTGRPGVVLLAVGSDRAEVVLHAVERGLVNHLLIDKELEEALHQTIDKAGLS
jgi:hypothetical protein